MSNCNNRSEQKGRDGKGYVLQKEIVQYHNRRRIPCDAGTIWVSSEVTASRFQNRKHLMVTEIN